MAGSVTTKLVPCSTALGLFCGQDTEGGQARAARGQAEGSGWRGTWARLGGRLALR